MFLNVFMSFTYLYKPLFGPSVHPSIYPSFHWFITKLFLRFFVASSTVFLNVLVCLSVCLPDFSESADARDLGLMTLLHQNIHNREGKVDRIALRICIRRMFLSPELDD